jgi:TPR repeat protein
MLPLKLSLRILLLLACFTASGAFAQTPLQSPPFTRDELVRVVKEKNAARLESLLGGLHQEFERKFREDDEIERTAHRVFRTFYTHHQSWDAPTKEWRDAHPKSYAAALSRGIYLLAVAWDERGRKTFDKLTGKQIDGMRRNANLAAEELQRAVSLSKHPVLAYSYLIEYEMLTGSTERAKRWYDKAVALDPKTYYPRREYMLALRPQWGGTVEQMEVLFNDYRSQKPSQWRADCLEATLIDQRFYRQPGYESDPKFLELAARGAKLCPNGDRYLRVGYIQSTMGKPQEAIVSNREAVRLDGNDYARSNLGKLLLDHGDVKEGIEICRELSNRNFASAMHCMSYAYRFGKGVVKDDKIAVDWLQKGAAGGDKRSMRDLAGFYERGEIVEKNAARAEELRRMAQE